jgi:uncharacterized LabA/DUF88 family protein
MPDNSITDNKKIAWLVDIGYVTMASKGRGKVDYLEARRFLEKKYNLPCSPILFNGVDSRYGIDVGLKQFYFTMERSGFVVKLYEMEGGVQKQVDVAIAAHIVYYLLKGCTTVLSSGDRDFVPALELGRSELNKVVLLTYNFGVHKDLSALSSEHLYFEDFPQILRK